MSVVALCRFVVLSLALAATAVRAEDKAPTHVARAAAHHALAARQVQATPLLSRGPFEYPDGIPYQVDPIQGHIRGPQFGYNICNSTTEGQDSRCQTAHFNSLPDFCLWGPPERKEQLGNIEVAVVAWCTQPGKGTRHMPAGTLKGLQFVKTPDYIQITGYIDQTLINMVEGDWGGELDPVGADGRGNPAGGIVISDAFTGRPIHAPVWHNFVGGDRFCFKLCDPNRPNPRSYCQNIYDRFGMDFSCPAEPKRDVFESCEGENQDPPGVYTSNGVAVTYTQPPYGQPLPSTLPFVVRTPAVSNCRTFASSALYTANPTVAPPVRTGTTTPVVAAVNTGVNTALTTARTTGTKTGTGSGAALPAVTGAASHLGASMGVTLVGVVVSALFLS